MSGEWQPGNEEAFGRSRRRFLRELGGALGVAMVADASKISSLAEAAAGKKRSAMPSGFVWHRVLTIGDGTPGMDGVEKILPGVMINDRSEIIFHAHRQDEGRAVYRMRIGHGRQPGAHAPQLIVESGQTLPNGAVVDRIAAGDTNKSGAYVTVIGERHGLNGVYMQRPGRALRQVLVAGDPIPGPRGQYAGHFGDVDMDDDNTIMVVARFTWPGELHQGLFALKNGRRKGGRMILRTGQRIPHSRATLTGLGLVERRGPFYIQQVFGRQPRHRRRHDFKLEPSGFVAGRLAKGRRGARLLVGAKLLRAPKAVKGEALVGPRIDRSGVAATVTHKHPKHLALHRHHRGHARRITDSGSRTHRNGQVETISAPLFGPHDLLYYRVVSKSGMELLVVDGDERRMVLETGDKVGGKRLRTFNTGWHTDQVDRHGRIAFQADLYDGRTAIVIGTPV